MTEVEWSWDVVGFAALILRDYYKILAWANMMTLPPHASGDMVCEGAFPLRRHILHISSAPVVFPKTEQLVCRAFLFTAVEKESHLPKGRRHWIGLTWLSLEYQLKQFIYVLFVIDILVKFWMGGFHNRLRFGVQISEDLGQRIEKTRVTDAIDTGDLASMSFFLLSFDWTWVSH